MPVITHQPSARCHSQLRKTTAHGLYPRIFCLSWSTGWGLLSPPLATLKTTLTSTPARSVSTTFCTDEQLVCRFSFSVNRPWISLCSWAPSDFRSEATTERDQAARGTLATDVVQVARLVSSRHTFTPQPRGTITDPLIRKTCALKRCLKLLHSCACSAPGTGSLPGPRAAASSTTTMVTSFSNSTSPCI